MQKAVIVVQGINCQQGYLLDNISASPVLRSYYHRVIDIPTEKYFDKYKPWFLKWMGKLGDSLSDVWEFYTRNSSRIELCREIRQQIKDLQATGYEVDIIAHSLGTMAALCSGPNTPANLVSVNRTILLSSPLGIGNLIARLKTNGHAERFSKNFITKELYYTWSEKDFVSERFTGRINDILASKSHTQPVIIHTGLSHSSEENLTYLLNSVEMYK